MKKRIVGAKIACLDINLQKARMQLGVQILVEDPEQLEEIRKRYAKRIDYCFCAFILIIFVLGKRKSHSREYAKFWLPELMWF
jgi:hypothetical protein